MRKIFNVVADLDNMSSDQMKGAIRNMENIGNLLHASFRAVTECTEDSDSVLRMSVDAVDQDAATEMYLPGVDGGTVIIRCDRPDMLVLWQLEFFAKWGNLNLSWFTTKTSSVHYDVEDCVASTLYFEARAEKHRSDAALYESMRNVK